MATKSAVDLFQSIWNKSRTKNEKKRKLVGSPVQSALYNLMAAVRGPDLTSVNTISNTDVSKVKYWTAARVRSALGMVNGDEAGDVNPRRDLPQEERLKVKQILSSEWEWSHYRQHYESAERTLVALKVWTKDMAIFPEMFD